MARPSTLEASIEPALKYVNGGYLEAGDVIPTVAGLAVSLGKRRETMHVWAKENEKFSNIIEALLSLQEKGLINNSLTGNFNPTITKLLLSKHGYSERQEIENRYPDGAPSVEVVWKNPPSEG